MSLRLSIIDAFSANLKKFGAHIEEAKQGAKRLGEDIEDCAKEFHTVGITMAATGAAITGALTAMVYKTVEVEEGLGHMSERTGETVETLSALSYAAKMSGTSIDQIETSLKFLTRAMDDTAKGTGTAKDTFAALGISVIGTEGNLRPMVDVLKDAATKIAAIQDPTRQAAITMELFGARAGTDLLPMLKMGGAGIEEFMKKAKELGLVITQEDVEASMEFDNSLKTLKESLAATGRDIAHVLIPPLMEFMNQAIKVVKNIREWADAHKPLVDILVKVASAVGVFLTVAGGTLLLLPKIVEGIKALQLVLLFLAVNPIVLVIAAIAALVAGLIYFYTTNEKFKDAIQTAGAYLEFFGRVVWEVVKTIGVNFKNFLGWFIGAFPDAFSTTFNLVISFLKNLGTNIANYTKYFAEKLNPLNWFKKIEPPDWTPLLKGFKSTIESIPSGIGLNLDRAKAILDDRLAAIGADVAKTKIPPPVIPPFDIDSTKKALLSLTEAEKAWYREREAYAGNFTEFTQKEIETIKDGYRKYYADLVKDSKEAIGKIEDEYFALTHTEKEELDKRWAMEEKNITATAKLAGEEANLTDILLKAKTIFYKDYYDKIGKAGTDYQKEMATLAENETALLEIEIESRKKALEEAGWTAIEIAEWEAAYRNKIREEELSKSEKLQLDYQKEMASLAKDETELLEIEIEERTKAYREAGLSEEEITNWTAKYRITKEKEKTDAIEKLQLDYQKEMATIAKDETKLLEIEIEKRIKSFREAGLNEEKIAAWVTAYRAQKAKETTDAIKIELDKETKLTQQYKNELADLELKASGDKQAILDRGWEREKTQLEEEFKSKKRTAEELLAFDEKLAAARALYYGKVTIEAKAASDKEVALIRKAEEDIEDIIFSATASKQQILDRAWERKKAQMIEDKETTKSMENAKILFYKNAALEEERIRLKLFESLTDNEKEYYSKITGYLGDYTEMVSTKLQEVKDDWANTGEAIKAIWNTFTTSVKSSWSTFFESLIAGTASFQDAWQGLCNSIKQSFIKALADSLVEKMGFDKIFEGNILNLGNLFGGLGNLITGIFKGVGKTIVNIFGTAAAGATAAGAATAEAATAAGTAAAGATTGIMAAFATGLATILLIKAAIEPAIEVIDSAMLGIAKGLGRIVGMDFGPAFHSLEELGKVMSDAKDQAAEYITGQEELVKKCAEDTLNIAQKWSTEHLEILDTTQMSTAELYEYTKEVAAQAIKSMNEGDKEYFEKSYIQYLDDAYNNFTTYYSQMLEFATNIAEGKSTVEGKTKDETIAYFAEILKGDEQLTEAQKENILELLGLTYSALAETEAGWDIVGEATGEATEETKKAIDWIKNYGLAGKDALDIIKERLEKNKNAVEEFRGKIGKIPSLIPFDVIGNLRMPVIPKIPDSIFNIIGKLITPTIPGYQMGTPYVPETGLALVHRGERISPAYVNRPEGWGGRSITGGGGIIFQRGAIRISHFGNITTEMDEEKFMGKVADRISNQMRRV